MLLTILYDWILPHKNDLTNSFKGDNVKINNAKIFLSSLDNCEKILFIACLSIAIISCISYYTWYNKITKPFGYHYRKRHWFGWLIIAIIIVLLTTFSICHTTIEKLGLPGTNEYVTNYMIANFFWCILTFGILSIIWCYCLRTNAYRWLKFGSSSKNQVL